jgi:YcaO-like protein with predicted kinase domain
METMLIFGKAYSQKKTHLDATHRARSPEETIRDYSRFMPQLGITRLANITGLDCVGIPVAVAIRPNSRSLAVSQGKGINLPAAKASALMESIELWHAEHIINPLRYESYETLRRWDPVVDIMRLPLRRGCQQLRLDRPMLWVEGWDIVDQRTMWVPFEFVCMNTVRPLGQEQTFFVSTNGLASGNHLLEALEHALCELIERDTIAFHFEEGASAFARCKVDLNTVKDVICSPLLASFRQAGIEVAVFDFTSHSSVPTFAAGIADSMDRSSWHPLGAFWGYGTHLSPVVALSRALTEAAQSRLTIISGSRDDNPHGVYASLTGGEQLESVREQVFNPSPVLAFNGLHSLATDTFEGDIEVLIDAILNLELNTAVVVDLTQPTIGIPVVKAIVPGLEIQAHGAPVQPGDRMRERLRRSSTTRALGLQ